MNRILVFGVFVLAAVSAEHLDPAPQHDASCNEGDTTSFDNCNDCFCSGGHWACTLKLCLNFDDQKVKRSVIDPHAPCQDGEVTSFDNGCNSCTCGNGHWACTMKFCFPSIANADERAKRHAFAKECTPYETKIENCNKCSCTETGLWICTRRLCNKKREAIAAGFDARSIQLDEHLLV